METSPEIWRHYYTPILDLIQSIPSLIDQMQHEPIFAPIKQADIQIGIHPGVLAALRESRWQDARIIARVNYEGLNLGYRADGIKVIAGQSWERPFLETEEQNG